MKTENLCKCGHVENYHWVQMKASQETGSCFKEDCPCKKFEPVETITFKVDTTTPWDKIRGRKPVENQSQENLKTKGRVGSPPDTRKGFSDKLKLQALKYAKDNDNLIYNNLTAKETQPLSSKRHRNAYVDDLDLDFLYDEKDVREFLIDFLRECEKNLELNKINYGKMVRILKEKAGADLI